MSLDEGVLVAQDEHRPCGIVVVGYDVAVARGGEVDGGVIVAFGRAAIDGDVKGSVNVLGGDAAVSGRVRGDVYASGVVRLSDRARVDGNVTGGEVEAADGAQVAGTTAELARGWAGMPRGRRMWQSAGARLLVKAIVTFVLAGIFGMLSALAAPGFVLRLRARASRGFGTLVAAVSLGLVVLAVTAGVALALRHVGGAVGIIAVPAVLALIGALGVGGRFGAWLLPGQRPAAQTALGLALVAVAATVALQLGHWAFFILGGVLFVLIGAWSIGLAVLTALDGRSPGRSPDRSTGRAQDAAMRSPGGSAILPDDTPTDRPATVEPAPLPTPVTTVGPRARGADDPAAVTPAPDRAHDGAAEHRNPINQSSPVEPHRSSALDLRRIPGISPIYAHLLRAAGIHSLVELADRDPDEIVACLGVPGVLGIDRSTAELWVAMARRRLGR